MRDYAELVKALRFAFAQPCYSCVLGEKCNWGDFCFFKRSADAIEELLDELTTIRKQLPHWISVEERLPERTNPLHARDIYLVRLEIGYIETLFYEYDNSDRCRPGMSPLIDEGWGETVAPVTHWMPLPEPPKEDAE